jgi:methionyl aminopeptidase
VSYGERIPIKSRREIEKMRVAACHVAEILLEVREMIEPGVTTGELDRRAKKSIGRRGVKSAFLGYSPGGLPPYPAVLCVSVNEEIVHGIPGKRELEPGDIVSLDFAVECDGLYGDSACTVPVGFIEEDAERLLRVTREGLYDAIAVMVPGKRLSDIGNAVQQRAEGAGLSVVRQFVGHGIGSQMHEPPQIPNFGAPGRGPRLMPGMVFAIEPMVNLGRPGARVLEDEWTAVTEDGALSAHFEHTVLITDSGPEIMTQIAGSH